MDEVYYLNPVLGFASESDFKQLHFSVRW